MPSTPVNFNATAVIEDAFLDLGIFAPGEAIPNEHAQFALRALNRLVSSLNNHPLTFPITERELFSLVAGQGSYTIGPGGDFNTVRPMTLSAVSLRVPAAAVTSGATELFLEPLTGDGYDSLPNKDLQGTQPAKFFYDPTYAGGLGTLYLWPTPTVTTNDVVIYRGAPVIGFANLVTFYDFPPGYQEMLQYQLEKRLVKAYGKAREWTPLDEQLASDALFLLKRQNSTTAYIDLDTTVFGDGGGYSILTG